MNQAKKEGGFNPTYRLWKAYLERETAKIPPSGNLKGPYRYENDKKIRRLKQRVYFLSAGVGALFVLVSIIPYHYFNIFGVQHFNIFGYTFDYELYFLIYIMLLIPPEIQLLHVINMRAIKDICDIYKTPVTTEKDYRTQIEILTDAGLEIPPYYLQKFKVNPYLGMPKLEYYGIYVINKTKGALTNFLAKFIVKRFLGRYVLKITVDMVGVPIYAFWDAWASHLVLKEAEIRIVAPSASKQFINSFPMEKLQAVKDRIPLVVNLVAQHKRKYNYGAYAYIKELAEKLPGLNFQTDHVIELREIMTGKEDENRLLAKLILFGMMIDGRLTAGERRFIRKHIQVGEFPLDPEEMEEIIRRYGVENQLRKIQRLEKQVS